MIGGGATGKSTCTTDGFLGTGGLKTGNGKRFCVSTLRNPTEGYRRITFMMLDGDLVAVSPSTVYRVLKDAGLLRRWNPGSTGKGKGFEQPQRPHEHWHVSNSR